MDQCDPEMVLKILITTLAGLILPYHIQRDTWLPGNAFRSRSIWRLQHRVTVLASVITHMHISFFQSSMKWIDLHTEYIITHSFLFYCLGNQLCQSNTIGNLQSSQSIRFSVLQVPAPYFHLLHNVFSTTFSQTG